jgi:hypothetical protein
MSLRALRSQLSRLEARYRARGKDEIRGTERLRFDPIALLGAAGLTPDPWQAGLIASPANRVLLLASRQSGKSTIAAAMALHAALTRPRSPVLLLSPSLRQSMELFRKVLDLNAARTQPLASTGTSALRLELANGSRIVSLPGQEKSIRGYSGVALLVIDEAARVDDDLYRSVRPMLAVSGGRLMALSTPCGKRGWFYEAWAGNDCWHRVRVDASECPRIRADFLAEEQRAMGERWFRQEYWCSFEEVTDAVFIYADVQAALTEEVLPLFGGELI